MLVTNTTMNARQTIDFSTKREEAAQPESAFGRDQVEVGRAESSPLPKGVGQATSGWLGNGGCLDFTGAAVQVESTFAENQSVLNACTGAASDVQSGFVSDSGLFMQCMTGSETEVRSTYAENHSLLNACTGGASDVQSGFVTDSGLFMQCMTGAHTDVKSNAPLSSF
jgi:hypothetical protein